MKPTIKRASDQLTESQIERAEKNFGRPIPPDYRRFLLQYNGGFPDPGDFEMEGMRKGKKQLGTVKAFLGVATPVDTSNLDYVLETFGDRLPARMFPVARDPGGNLIVISMHGEDAHKVYFWDHERESGDGEPATEANLYFIADNFDQFLDQLR